MLPIDMVEFFLRQEKLVLVGGWVKMEFRFWPISSASRQVLFADKLDGRRPVDKRSAELSHLF